MQKRWVITEEHRRWSAVASAMCDATTRPHLDALSAAGILDLEERTEHIVKHHAIERLNHVMWLTGERRGRVRGVA